VGHSQSGVVSGRAQEFGPHAGMQVVMSAGTACGPRASPSLGQMTLKLPLSGPEDSVRRRSSVPAGCQLTATIWCMTDAVTVTESARPAFATGAEPFRTEVLIFPHRVEGDHGIYSDQLVSTVKAMRDEGIDVEWYHDADLRLWSGERSFATVVAIPYIVSVGAAAGWAAITRVFRRRHGDVKLKIGYRKDASGEEKWLELDGDSASVAQVLENLNPWQSAKPSLEEGDNGDGR